MILSLACSGEIRFLSANVSDMYLSLRITTLTPVGRYFFSLLVLPLSAFSLSTSSAEKSLHPLLSLSGTSSMIPLEIQRNNVALLIPAMRQASVVR